MDGTPAETVKCSGGIYGYLRSARVYSYLAGDPLGPDYTGPALSAAALTERILILTPRL